MSQDDKPRSGRPPFRKPPYRGGGGKFGGKFGGGGYGGGRRPVVVRPGVREDGNHVLYGIHTVIEALKNPRRVFVKLVGTENGLNRLRELTELTLEPEIVKPEDIGRQLPSDAVHQGVLLIAQPLVPLEIDDLPDTSIVLALDQVTDPHNVGAVLRSAAAFGVHAVVVTGRHSPEVTGVLAKAASGGLEHVPFVEVKNLGKALAALSERGFQVLGLDSDGSVPLSEVKLRRPLCLVLGAEGKGLRPITRENCEAIVRLPMPGAIQSLNVSNAAAISLYAVTQGLPSA
jgi:23S rRNA (guanosine2251-2'-O)-methyltransferase